MAHSLDDLRLDQLEINPSSIAALRRGLGAAGRRGIEKVCVCVCVCVCV